VVLLHTSDERADLLRAKQMLRATAGRIRTYVGSHVVMTALWQHLTRSYLSVTERIGYSPASCLPF
jgi:hypothetical protein